MLLPYEIWVEIFLFLVPKQAIKLNTTTSVFHKITKDPVFWKLQMEKKIEINWKEEFQKRKFFTEKRKPPYSICPCFPLIQYFTSEKLLVAETGRQYLIQKGEKFFILNSKLEGMEASIKEEDVLEFELLLFSIDTGDSFEYPIEFKHNFHKELIDFIEKRYLSSLSLIYIIRFLNFLIYKSDLIFISETKKSQQELFERLMKMQIINKIPKDVAEEDYGSSLFHEEEGLFECKFFGMTSDIEGISYNCCHLIVQPNDFSFTTSVIWRIENENEEDMY
eukprot:gene8091-12552_t